MSPAAGRFPSRLGLLGRVRAGSQVPVVGVVGCSLRVYLDAVQSGGGEDKRGSALAGWHGEVYIRRGQRGLNSRRPGWDISVSSRNVRTTYTGYGTWSLRIAGTVLLQSGN